MRIACRFKTEKSKGVSGFFSDLFVREDGNVAFDARLRLVGNRVLRRPLSENHQSFTILLDYERLGGFLY